MKSQRFSMPRLPFRRSERTAQKPRDDQEKQPTLEERLTSATAEEEEFGSDEEGSERTSPDSREEEVMEPTQEEQFAAIVVKEEEFGSDGEECELHVYETKYDSRGEEITLRAGTKSKITPSKPRSHRACLVLNRQYRRFGGKVSWTELKIQSRHVIGALRKVISTYPGVDFATNPVRILEPPRCLFHYQDELRRYAEESDNEKEKSHVHLCLQYMEKTLHREIRILESSGLPELEYRDLWIAFKPGCLVIETVDERELSGRLGAISEEKEDDGEIVAWVLTVKNVLHCGKITGTTYFDTKIKRYTGCKPICELSAIPLHLHPNEKKLRCSLLERGRKYLSLWGIHQCFYDGIAWMGATRRENVRIDEQSLIRRFPVINMETSQVNHRIMLDMEEAKRNSFFKEPIPDTKTYASGLEASRELSDEEIMTCAACLPGYSLELKEWGEFYVINVTEVAYNDTAFDGLVLQEQKKKLITSLLERQDCQQEDSFDDLIQGKGKGLIFLLHGPPGVGKTYTAESIADHTRRPLLKASATELGGSGSEVEEKMAELFSLAVRWSGIILLDEADVYMQDRALNTLQTNQLVSTLLRILEYYEGVLFLTTNREQVIDYAFRSRIHLFIAYPPLSADARRELWTNCIVRANHGQTPDWLSTRFLDHLAEQDVNGREIKNVVRVGHSLARSARRDMTTEDILLGMYALKECETGFDQSPERKHIEKTAETTA